MQLSSLQVILINSLYYFSRFLSLVIFIRIICSWLPVDRNGTIMRILYALTEPILSPIRNLLFKSPLGGPGMMLDFSPMIAMLLIELARGLLTSLIAQF